MKILPLRVGHAKLRNFFRVAAGLLRIHKKLTTIFPGAFGKLCRKGKMFTFVARNCRVFLRREFFLED
jgi:hypothetical protein